VENVTLFYKIKLLALLVAWYCKMLSRLSDITVSYIVQNVYISMYHVRTT